MPSRTYTVGHTKAFIYPVIDLGVGGGQSAPAQGRFEPPTCRSTVEHDNHQTMMTMMNYTPGPQWGDLLPIGGDCLW